MRKAIAHTASYDTAITATLKRFVDGERSSAVDRHSRCPQRSICRCTRSATCATARIRISGRLGTRRDEPRTGTGIGAADILQGRELSFTNLLDLDSALRIVLEFDEPAAAVIKHTNPCGAAIGASAVTLRARPRGGQPGRVRRNRGGESPDRCRAGGGDRVDVHRSGDRAEL
jgi:phosphoribosylaminoimidazolecarboxamide formyltransferase/IMP cyclohydrolase